MNKEELVTEVLCLPYTAIEYAISERLAKLFPDKALVEGNNYGFFDVEKYAGTGQCVLTAKTFLHNQKMTYWMQPEAEVVRWHRGHMHAAMPGMVMGQVSTADGKDGEKSIGSRYKKAWLEVEWQGASLDLLMMQFDDGDYHKSMFWMLADSEEVARNFMDAVCRWNMEVRGEVLVFDNGHWYKDEHLYQDIKDATFDNLILRGSLKQDIRDDLTQFFAARDTYEEYGIPWKRGILFVGPPGNGKTHTVKALINSMAQPCLYVKSLKLPGGAPDDMSIRQVFERARRSAPCILVLEDLDALLTPQNRSFFLNELDGFAANIGIVTLATTNHPERLDPAILDRPSRFDRKYPFDLPEVAERKAYIAMWNASLKPALRLSDEGIDKLSALTEGFSFAYLKELFLSSMMRWIANPQQGAMEEVMSGQVAVLREQMASSIAYQEAEQPPDMSPMPPGFHTGMMRSRMIRFRGGM
jgi:AAA+ superfamily predicted ATPase